MIFNLLSFSCPLILASFAALFTEYAGCLALFLEGLISLSAFLFYAFSVLTHSYFAGALLTLFTSTGLVFLFSILTEKFKSNKFISAIALNLLFSALPSCLSFFIFGSRGLLVSDDFIFTPLTVRVTSLTLSFILILAAILFLAKTRAGLYLRITGSDSDVLTAKGVNPSVLRTTSWTLGAFYASFSGIFLAMKISSFVPNISSGRGWLALAAIFLGKKKPLKILICVILFCCADLFSANIQNLLQGIPSSVIISFPYLVVLALIFFNVV